MTSGVWRAASLAAAVVAVKNNPLVSSRPTFLPASDLLPACFERRPFFVVVAPSVLVMGVLSTLG